MDRYTVKHHSGKSVFEWRVYGNYRASVPRVVTKQLGKFRTREAAEAWAAKLNSRP